MKKELMLIGFLLQGGAQAAGELNERFSCESGAPEFIRIAGSFQTVDGRPTEKGGGLVIVHEERNYSFEGVGYLRGMWTSDRLNLIIRNFHGGLLLGFVMDDYFSAGDHAPQKATLYDSSHSYEVVCTRAEPVESKDCNLPPFCGQW